MHPWEDDILPDLQQRGFDNARLERQLQVFLDPRLTQEDLRHIIFSFANVATQLVGGRPLSPNIMTEHAAMAYPFGLENSAAHVCRYTTSRYAVPPREQ